MRTHAKSMVVAAGALLAWFAVGCSGSNDAPVIGSGAGGTSPRGGAANTGGLSPQSGGAVTGGNATGGVSNGGTPAGGTNAGGTSSEGGGASTGGKSTGGTVSVGGSATGGSSTQTGGAATTGGTAVGGNATGGKAAGGNSTGGANTGGKAVGGNQSTGGSATGGTLSAGGATGTPGCNGTAAPPTSPSDGYLTITVGGTARTYVLELPTGYNGTTPVPVIFTLHGTGTTAQEFLGSGYGDVRAGIAGRTLIVGPQGASRSGQTGWASDQADIDFFDALVVQLKANYCIDPGRIFAMGHSAGAFFSNTLGCVRSGVIRGVGPFNGGGPDGACGGKVAAFIVHNPNDQWSSSGWPTVQYWTSHNGCSAIGAMPTVAFAGNSTTGNPLPCQAYADCDANYPVTLCLHSYSDQWDGAHAFAVQWGGKAVTDFFLGLPKVQ